METESNPQDSSPLMTEGMWWGTLGSVRPFPNFRAERDVTVLQAALEKKDVSTVVRILTNRSNSQRQSLARAYKNVSQKDLDASLKKVLSGDLQSLILGLMMTPEQFEAHRLRKAMEGAGTDEETLLEVLCTRTPRQLSNITTTYSQEFKRDLEKDLLSESSGDFSKLIVALLKKENGSGVIDQDIVTLSEELKNKKPAADVWIRILTSRHPDHLRVVLDELEFENGQTVEDALEGHFKGVLSGDLRKGLKTLVRCIQSQHLFLAQRIQTMKAAVVQGVIVSHSEEDLLRVRVAFLQLTGTSLYTALQKQFKGDLQQGLLAVCRAED
ncbi:annexin A2 isoform X1 [Megalobrama amblycephala]|uniref:annexin A2 isoform X1 n=1 Tax=Megalobrama amblycephala TaxID=75352 RepID=UPI00201403E6|nr:annexin A2 isoform X1 [Megalobrama amblycephala]XP_048057007.1 annexin A2 isoform X1 [Megalobrama amblycephala]XP_048057008.1 annexin A2 isoform X1 [Megalobrama amblycephala]